MRHRKSGKKLGRTWEHRKAMFRNMAKSLIVHERIRTTVPKAKELSKIVDKLVSLAIRNDLSARRQAYKVLENHKLVQRLFNEIGPKFSNGQGGYTRVVKFAQPRVGDSAAMALIEFTYFDSLADEKTKPKSVTPAAASIPVMKEETQQVPETEAAPEEQPAPQPSEPLGQDQAGSADLPVLEDAKDEQIEEIEQVQEALEEQEAPEEKVEKKSEHQEPLEDTGPEEEKK